MEEALYLGMDFCESYVMISYYSFQSKEPKTVSSVTGSKVYKIPFCLAKKSGVGQWYYGDEAIKAIEDGQAVRVNDFYSKSMNKEEIEVDKEAYQAIDLLALYFRKVLSLAKRVSGISKIASLAISCEEVDENKATLCHELADYLDIDQKSFFVLDKKESFYYYALSQKAELWQTNCAVFHVRDNQMVINLLYQNEKTIPQVIKMEEYIKKFDFENKDQNFCDILSEVLGQIRIGTVYLVGDLFEKDWMKDSLKKLCMGRRVFIGKNLYSKGACVASLVKTKTISWQFLYIGNHEIKYNIGIMVKDGRKEYIYPLILAGETWYETKTSCEVVLDMDNQIEFILEYPDKSKHKTEVMILDELPKRPNKATRLRISAKPVSDTKIEVSIKDLGFGEFFLSSEKKWKKCFNF